MPTGYSGTPLFRKLGLQENFKVRIVNPPANYTEFLPDIVERVQVISDKKTPKDFIHFFTKSAAELKKNLPELKKEIASNGMIWISWPKKAAKIPTDVTEDVIREMALKTGLVDIKVCAVDEIWSGLKLVIPVKDRK